MANLLPNAKQAFITSTGAPAVGYKLYTYAAGTSTPQATYSDAAGLYANTNPVIMDVRGEALIYWSGNYKVVLKTDADVMVWTVDNVADAVGALAAILANDMANLANNTSPVLGSSLVGYLPAGTGAVGTTVQAKLRDVVSTKDFGVVGDGTADDTTAFNAARAAARTAGLPLLIFGTPKITSALTISTKEHWIFQGTVGNSSGSRPSSYLIKAATVAADLVTITAANTLIEFGGILGIAGNTGDGYVIKANGVTLNYPYVEGCGQDGIRVGVDAVGSGINANSFLLIRPTSSINGRHGIHVSMGTGTTYENANAGTIIHSLTQYNTGDGIRIGNAYWISLLNPLTENNTGYGLYISEFGSVTVTGGDSEQNVAGPLYQPNPQKNSIDRLDVQGFHYSTWLNTGPLISSLTTANIVQNPTFSSDTLWIKSAGALIAANKLTLTAASSASQQITTLKGASYRIRITVATAATRGVLQVGSNGAGTFDLLNAGYITTSGTLEYSFTAVSENTWIQFLNDVGSSGVWEISSCIVNGNIAMAGGITSNAATGAGIGYATGAGGAVTQATNRTTGVSLNTLAGAITTHNASLAAEASAAFTVTNSTVAIGDTVVVSMRSGSNGGNTAVAVSAVAAGSFDIRVSNNNAAAGTAETGAIVINYAVIKAVSA